MLAEAGTLGGLATARGTKGTAFTVSGFGATANTIGGVTSFGLNVFCRGVDLAYRTTSRTSSTGSETRVAHGPDAPALIKRRGRPLSPAGTDHASHRVYSSGM